MRKTFHHHVGVRQVHLVQQPDRALVGFLVRQALVTHRNFYELFADLHRRVEGCHGLLIDHGDVLAADSTQLGFVHGTQVLSHEVDFAGDDRSVPAEVLHDSKSDRRLSASRFADQPDRFAGHDRQVEIDDRLHLSTTREIGKTEIFAFQNGVRGAGQRHKGNSPK